MKSNNKLCIISAAVLSVLASGTLFAQESGDYYGGLSYGQTRAKIDEQRITNIVLGGRASSTSLTTDNKDSGYKAFLGYQLNPTLALEAGYVNLGKFNFSSRTVPAGSLNGQIRVQGAILDLVGRAPLTENLSLIGRIGASYTRTRDSFSSTGPVVIGNVGSSDRKVNYKAGVGVQYALSPAVLVRIEAERYRINDGFGEHGHVNMYSAGLVIPFGGGRKPYTQVATSTYVAPVPAPAPAPAPPPVQTVAPVAAAPVAPPPPPQRQRVSFSAESLFAFNRSDLRPEGKSALDKFANDLRGTSFDNVMVEGHTDRLGTNAYNQKLSETRANAVKAYMVNSGRLDQNKISAMGKGETSPVTKDGDCKGNTPTKRLIECLQPDRRVDVVVTVLR